MVFAVKLIVLAVKLFVSYIKINIFFAKHDDDVLGNIGHGVIDGIEEEIRNYVDALQQ